MVIDPSEIRVLVIDDEVDGSRDITAELRVEPALVVVGIARSGAQAVTLARTRRAHVAVQRVHGERSLEILAHFLARERVPVVAMVQNPTLGIAALSRGAVEAMSFDALASELRQTVRLMSSVRVFARPASGPNAAPAVPEPTPYASPPAMDALSARRTAAVAPGPRLVVLGASTGGPPALAALLSRIPAAFPAPILIAQHMPADFPSAFAEWLGRVVELPVRVVGPQNAGQLAENGTVYVASAEADLILALDGRLWTQEPLRVGARPSVDRLFESVAKLGSWQLFGVVLSGMGRDGGAGLLAIRNAGGETLVQDARTSVVASMPENALKMGGAIHSLPPEGIGDRIAIWALGRVKLPGGIT